MFRNYERLSVIGLLFIIISSFLFVVLFVFRSLLVAKAAFCISRNPTSIPSHRLMRDVPSAARSAIVCTKGLATIFELVLVPLDEVDGFLASLEQHLKPPTVRAPDAVLSRFHSSSNSFSSSAISSLYFLRTSATILLITRSPLVFLISNLMRCFA